MLGTMILLTIGLVAFQLYWNRLSDNVPITDTEDHHTMERNMPMLR
jgi:hypothetical protein